MPVNNPAPFFSQGDDDEDAPMISGFSDDVPMVIA